MRRKDSPGPVERRIDREYTRVPATVSITSLPLGGVHVDHHRKPSKEQIEESLRITPDM